MSSPGVRVLFSAAKSERDSVLKFNVKQVPLADGVEGSLFDMTQTTEPDTRKGEERDRVITYKLFVEATPSIEDWIKQAGFYVIVTHQEQDMTRSLRPLDETLQFAVHHVGKNIGAKAEYVLSMTIKPEE